MTTEANEAAERDEISQELQRVLASICFSKSVRLQRFLKYVVGCIESGELDQIREYNIAMEVFQRKSSFDQRLDPIVRVEASRLRAKLRTYYETEGKDSPLIIELPRGTYVPVVRRRSEPAQEDGADSGQGEAGPEICEQPQAPPAPTRWWRSGWFAVVAWALVLGLQVTTGFMLWEERSGRDMQAEAVRVTSDNGLTAYPALSADGKLLAYSSDRGGHGNLSLWIQPLSGGSPRRLTHGAEDDRDPSFSPDSAEIAFRSETDGGGIYSVSVFGGSEPRLIAKEGYRPRYSPDGASILYWTPDEDSTGGQIRIVPAHGGRPRLLAEDFEAAQYPIWSPDGKHVLFCGAQAPGRSRGEYDWWVVPKDGGLAIRTRAAESFAAYFGRRSFYTCTDLPSPAAWVDKGIIFSAHRNAGEHLYVAAITHDTFQIASSPQQLTYSTGVHVQPAAGGGRLAFVSGQMASGIWSLPVAAVTGTAIGAVTKLTFNLYDSSPSLSDDGRLLAYINQSPEGHHLSIRDLRTGTETVLEAPPETQRSALISPDGSRAVYRVVEGPKHALYVVSTAGGEPDQICENCGRPTSWSPDGRYIAFELRASVPSLSALEVSSRRRFDAVKDTGEGIHSGAFSPDGRWIAFHTRGQKKPPQVYVTPFRTRQTATRQDWIEVSTGHTPAWSPNGRLLYFLCERDGFRCIWARRLHPQTRRPEGEPFPVQHFHAAERSLLVNLRKNPAAVGLTAAGEKLVFAMDEFSGNIWLLPF